jgi:hypothetical protein
MENTLSVSTCHLFLPLDAKLGLEPGTVLLVTEFQCSVGTWPRLGQRSLSDTRSNGDMIAASELGNSKQAAREIDSRR